ncbi:MAG: flagellar basal body-associated FliL family protein [Planctomycetaceae bacterium]|nr:flagellar basal body-associated FliL family protein [Planctomycetaceae bacterium]
MATDAPEEEVQEVEEAEGEKKPVSFWLKLAAIAGLVLLVIIAQFALIIYVFAPSDGSEIDPEDESILNGEDLEETNLKEMKFVDPFNCTNSLASQGQSIHVTFKLCVDVPENLSEQFTEAKKNRLNRIEEAVVTIIRNAGAEELNDPYLSTIKRQIKEEINKILNQSFVTSVIIGGWRKTEQ